MYQYKSKAFTHEAIICDFKKFVLDFEELTENSSRDKVGVANVMIVHMLLDIVNKVYPKVTAATRTPQKRKVDMMMVTGETEDPLEKQEFHNALCAL